MLNVPIPHQGNQRRYYSLRPARDKDATAHTYRQKAWPGHRGEFGVVRILYPCAPMQSSSPTFPALAELRTSPACIQYRLSEPTARCTAARSSLHLGQALSQAETVPRPVTIANAQPASYRREEAPATPARTQRSSAMVPISSSAAIYSRATTGQAVGPKRYRQYRECRSRRRLVCRDCRRRYISS